MSGLPPNNIPSADIPGLDALKDYTLARMEVGAQIQRVPVILLLDIPAERTADFEPFLRSLFAWLYAFNFDTSLRNSQCRISLSIMTTAEGGAVLLPPRLLKEFPGVGLSFFRNRSWIARDALEALLFPLCNGGPRGMAGVRQAFNAYFTDDSASVYAVGKGDARCLTILVTGEADPARDALWETLTRMGVFQDKCHALCIWRPLEAAPTRGCGDSGDGTFLATGDMQNGLAEALTVWLDELANRINHVYLHAETLRPKGKNVFPDVMLPYLRGVMPAVSFSERRTHGYALVPLASDIRKDSREICRLSLTMALQLPAMGELDSSGVQFAFTTPAERFSGIQCEVASGGIRPDKDYRLYLLTVRCAPAKAWDEIYTGLNFRAQLSLTFAKHTYEATLLGTVWMPPTSSHSYVWPPPEPKPEVITPPIDPPGEGQPDGGEEAEAEEGKDEPTHPEEAIRETAALPARKGVPVSWVLCVLLAFMFLVALLTRGESDEKLTGRLKEKEAEIEALNRKVNEQEKELARFRSDTAYADLQEKYEALQQEYEDYRKNEGNAGDKGEIKRLERDLQVAKEQIKVLESRPAPASSSDEEIQKLKRQLGQADIDLAEANRKLEEAQKENERPKSNPQGSGDSAKIQELREANNQLEADKEALRQALEAERNKNSGGTASPAAGSSLSGSVLADEMKKIQGYDDNTKARQVVEDCKKAMQAHPGQADAIRALYETYAWGRQVKDDKFLGQFLNNF